VRGLSLKAVLAAFCACASLGTRAATFEVVMKKPDKDPVSYEKPPPRRGTAAVLCSTAKAMSLAL
jgi:hypothetical protein